MTAVSIAPTPILQFFDNTGNPAVGGSVLTQVGGINAVTYSDSAGTIPLPNPIPLNSRGEVSTAAGLTSQVFLPVNTVYTFTLFDVNGNQLWSAPYVYDAALTQISVGAALYPQTSAEVAVSVTPVNYYYAPYTRGRYNTFSDWAAACNQAGTIGILEASYAITANTPLPNSCDFKGFQLTGGFNSSIASVRGVAVYNWNALQPTLAGSFYSTYTGINTGVSDTGGMIITGASGGTAWNKFDINYTTSLTIDESFGYITQNIFRGGVIRFLHLCGSAGNEINTNVFDNVDISSPSATNLASGTVTISNASPAVVTWTSHGKNAGDAVAFAVSSGGSLPVGLSTSKTYYVIASGLTSNTFEISATLGGTAINATSAGSGTITATSFGALQDDSLREINTFRNVYYENGSNIVGNFHLNGWHGDGLGNPALDRYKHAMFNQNSNQRLAKDFLSVTVSNLVTGGNWDILDTNGKPIDLSQSGGSSPMIVVDTTEPSGMGKKYQVIFSAAFSNFTINVQPAGSATFGLYLYYQSTSGPFNAVTSNNGSGAINHSPTPVLIDPVNNWYALWISGPASPTVVTIVSLFAFGATGGGPNTISIGGMCGGAEGAIIPPQRNNGVISGSCTLTLNGVTGTVTVTAQYERKGNSVTLNCPTLTGTSSATTCTISGLPSNLWPSRIQGFSPVYVVDHGSTPVWGGIQLNTSGILSCYKSVSATGNDWTASGTKTIGSFNLTWLTS